LLCEFTTGLPLLSYKLIITVLKGCGGVRRMSIRNGDHEPARRLVILLLVFTLPALCLAVWIALSCPIESIMPAYLDFARQLSNGNAANNFLPVGYPELISGWLGGNVEWTLRIVQLGSLLATWAIVEWHALKTAREYNSPTRPEFPISAVFWLLVVLFNPYFLIGLIRVSDSAVDILFMAGLFAFAIWIKEARVGHWILAGLALALFTFVRPNAIVLIFALAIIALAARARLIGPAALVVSAVAGYLAFSQLFTGKLIFWPTNGGYNLFAGNNPFAMEHLTKGYNAELSLGDGLAWCGLSARNWETVPGTDYLRCALHFISSDPVGFVQLVLYKTYDVLFRPNLRLANSPIKVAAQYVIIGPAIVWWVQFVASRSFRLSAPGRAGIIFLIIYTLPFALTNADTRFRIPLDIVYAMSALAFSLGNRAQFDVARTCAGTMKV
jgi:hypothetical protein